MHVSVHTLKAAFHTQSYLLSTTGWPCIAIEMILTALKIIYIPSPNYPMDTCECCLSVCLSVNPSV